MSKRIRGFEVVDEKHRTAFRVLKDKDTNKEYTFPLDIKLPTRADIRSAGYDFYLPKDVEILPSQKTIIWTDVKAYMQDDELLELYIRSSLAIKHGLMLSNNVGIVDASYYGNSSNDGNIGLAVVNTSGRAIKLKAGDRIAQGVFKKYLVADEDKFISNEREGGFGSSGK